MTFPRKKDVYIHIQNRYFGHILSHIQPCAPITNNETSISHFGVGLMPIRGSVLLEEIYPTSSVSSFLSLVNLRALLCPGAFKKRFYEPVNLTSLKISSVTKITYFNVWSRYFVWNFKGTIWNSTQIHSKIRLLYNVVILRAFKFKSSYAFLKLPLVAALSVRDWIRPRRSYPQHSEVTGG